MRRPLDDYETAPWQVDALVDHLPELNGSIWCPCVGDGSLMRRLQERRPDLGPFVTSDIDRNRRATYHGDAAQPDHWSRMIAQSLAWPDWVVENPPFSLALPILQNAWRSAARGVVLMVRTSFTEPTRARGPWLKRHPYSKRITLERFSFTGTGKTDSTTTDWIVWSRYPVRGHLGISAYGYRERG